MRRERATIRIDAASRPAETVFRLTRSREFERVGHPNPEARLIVVGARASNGWNADAIPEGGAPTGQKPCATCAVPKNVRSECARRDRHVCDQYDSMAATRWLVKHHRDCLWPPWQF